ncbi:hypothetical protein ACHWQZ_G017223 [Mnemiopsis leidyi]
MSGDYDATQYGLAISSVLIAVTGIGSNSLSLSYFIAQLGSTAVPQAVLANLTSFITCLIAVIRAVDLVRLPNVMKGRRMTTNLAIFVYSLITVCLAIFEMFHISKKEIAENVTPIALSVIGANMTAMFVIIIVSNIVCMFKLYLTQSQGIVTETRHATVTVGILSLIYCLCSL